MLLSHLEYLVAVKKYGSMNKAAAELFCTQPTITNAFKSLEKELDCKIVERTPSGISFTPLGEQIVADAKVMLNMVESWKNAAKSPGTVLNVAFANSSVKSMVDILFAYQREKPNVKVKLVSNTNRGVDVLKADDGSFYRFGFFLHTPAELVETKKKASKIGMKVAKIDRGSFALCLHPEHPLINKPHIYLHDLSGMSVVLKDGPSRFPYVSSLLETGCDCSMALGDHENVLLAIVNNPELISFRPTASMLYDYYVSRGLICIREVDDALFEMNQYMFYPEFNRMNSEERSFVDHIRANAKMFIVE